MLRNQNDQIHLAYLALDSVPTGLFLGAASGASAACVDSAQGFPSLSLLNSIVQYGTEGFKMGRGEEWGVWAGGPENSGLLPAWIQQEFPSVTFQEW